MKTCLGCQHCRSWSYPATREEPGEEGWECPHPNVNNEEDFEDPQDIAETCSFFEQIDWAAIHQLEEEINKSIEEEFKYLEAINDSII
ncbi:hypothetical protein NG799_02100 [Laspinema sp. D1]|uniref:Uncharacterized protein n=1 Tax=Laspinema palackyanum D2a TaxID=2953684 RepID=A0ABT2MK55_9CYAN|nr:hypothetical protein [Laspinema sp. D2a]